MREPRAAFRPVIVAEESRESIYEPPVTRMMMKAAPPAVEVDAAIVARLIAILVEPHPGETIAVAYHRKEQAFARVLAELAVPEALALHRRLANPREADELATVFARMTAERRSRLLAFLADARRRAALAHRS